MKASTLLLAVVPVAVLCVAWACSSSPSSARAEGQEGAAARSSRSQPEMLAYGVGYYLGEEVREGLQTDGVEADLDLLTRGFTDGLRSRQPMLAREELDEVLHAVHQEMQKRMVARLLEEDPNFRKLHDDNLAASRAFLESYGREAGVAALPGGIYYRVLGRGPGAMPTIGDTVVVRYRGTLPDGTEFSEEDRAVLHVKTVMEGARRVLTAMHVGDHWQVAVPPDLAFGAAGNAPLVGPNQVLLFDVELLEVRPSKG